MSEYDEKCYHCGRPNPFDDRGEPVDEPCECGMGAVETSRFASLEAVLAARLRELRG